MIAITSFGPVIAGSLPAPAAFAASAEDAFLAAKRQFLAEPTNAIVAGTFARACFDRAESAANPAERAALAGEGIAACRDLLGREPGCAPAHYYLGMNLGQLARTKTLGALRIVEEMEREFKAARALDERLDHAGPDRNLGLLYLEAPRIGSVGNRNRAHQHLQRAVELEPEYPENRLNLVEAELKWNDRVRARAELKTLEALWPAARSNLVGEAWTRDWADWETRLVRARQRVDERLQSPHGQP